jgi:predicted hotdog family 3-hydroxylacyl-ACP dehydratase
MALHGALSGGAGVRGGALASLRGLTASVERLDVLAGPLLVAAERLHGEADRMIYGFALRHDGQIVLKGRAAVALA